MTYDRLCGYVMNLGYGTWDLGFGTYDLGLEIWN